MQLDEPVRVTATDAYFVVDKAGVDMHVQRSPEGWEVTIDMIESSFRVCVGLPGKQLVISHSGKITTQRPIVELKCVKQTGCIATLSLNTKRALQEKINLVPDYATVWAATANRTTLFLVTEHPRGGWMCDSCGTEYDLLKKLCEHLHAPQCAKFRRVSKSGIIDGLCPPPSLMKRKQPHPRWAFSINPDVLRKKIKEAKTPKIKSTVQKLSLKPSWG